MAVHMYCWNRVNEVNRHEWLSIHEMFRQHALNIHTYSKIKVVQNGVYLIAFLAKHQVVKTDINLWDLI